MKDNKSKKEILFSIMSVLFLIVVVVGISYAMFTFIAKGTTKNTITIGNISFIYNEETNGISLSNAQPITDEDGKMMVKTDSVNGIGQGYFDFSVKGAIRGQTIVKYEVYASTDIESTMDSEFVKIYLTDQDEQPVEGFVNYVPTFNQLSDSNINSGKVLYQGNFDKGTIEKKFRLRIWVASSYTQANIPKTFTININVSAVA